MSRPLILNNPRVGSQIGSRVITLFGNKTFSVQTTGAGGKRSLQNVRFRSAALDANAGESGVVLTIFTDQGAWVFPEETSFEFRVEAMVVTSKRLGFKEVSTWTLNP